MSTEASVERYSFVATFELRIGNQSIELGQIAPEFIIPRRAQKSLSGPAELIIHYSDRPALHHQIEVLGPDPDHPERLLIRR